MSKVGKAKITRPKGVDIVVDKDNNVVVKGPKGTSQVKPNLPNGISLQIEEDLVTVVCNDKDLSAKQSKDLSAKHGLFRSLVENSIIGVTQGYTKVLKIEGVGYKAELKGNKLDLRLGFSTKPDGTSQTIMDIPQGITVTVEKAVGITISGIEKQVVGQFAADVRAQKKPEPYKGKGIQYVGERIRRKEGKAAGKGKA